MITGMGGRLIPAVAELLADHHVVGWVQGGMEFGPCALGHRSILAHPGRTQTRDRVNAINQRTGLTMLLNTSFNTKGAPILMSAEQAVHAAADLGLDAVAINDSLLVSDKLPTR
ncbi:carbamoyltransferase C-terminal domain-containing protein [Nonomuraea sp. B19D2]|uniref:carbamoyltransferase C-terminal domain-containing protein n=1 Tax=Nonomuraea sp. B19D2 TaxID=3159561 RepID=UPI0032DBD3C2